ncbi:MAG: SPFH domain-containing protein [Geobacteraceae bacterium]|nr:SPFH domain-containing protein [Geobacteraceae bacterium]
MRRGTKYTVACLFLCVWLVGGCGYHLPGRGDAIPADVKKIFVEVMVNRTAEPFIENKLTSEVRAQFARRPGFEVVSKRSKSDAIISGTG